MYLACYSDSLKWSRFHYILYGVCSQAKIILTLRNRGIEAYKTDEYGNSIMVCRKISKDGASEYQLKNSSGNDNNIINLIQCYI